MAMIQHDSQPIDALVHEIQRKFSDSAAALWLVDPQGSVSSLKTYAEDSEGYLLLASNAVSLSLEFVRRKPFSTATVIRRDEVAQFASAMAQTWKIPADLIVAPMKHGDNLVGVFVLLCHEGDADLTRAQAMIEHLERTVIASLFGQPELHDSGNGHDVVLGDGLFGRSTAMRKVMADVRRVAGSDLNVFIIGESGTGKELIARNIHKLSPRSHEAFIPVDPVALPPQLLESELFGHEKGAFTGATHRKRGIFEYANHGTLFLDEICELQFDLQAKLLRAIQEREFRRVGGRQLIDVDVRLISATNRDPDEAVRDKRLREDLFFRLNGVPIYIPPLRERREDIPVLVEHFAAEYSKRSKVERVRLTDGAIECLYEYDWPGNVRQLQHVVERLITLTDKEVVSVADLPDELVHSTGSAVNVAGSDAMRGLSLEQARKQRLATFERDYLCHLLQRYRGNISQVAKAAGTSRKTIYQILKRHSISHLDFKRRSPSTIQGVRAH